MLTAALTAPLVGVVAAFVFVVVLLDLTPDLGARGVARFFRDFMMFGSAVAYLVGAVVGIPAYAYVRRRRPSLQAIVLVAALAGVIAFFPVLRGLTGSARAMAGTAAVGAVSGACAGAWFWLVAFGRRSSSVQDEPP